MSNVAIYYSMNQLEKTDEVIEQIENLIKKIEGKVMGVYIDPFGSSENFNMLINEDINKLEILYLNRELEDDFDAQLINELAKASSFKIIYFSEI